MELPQMDAAVHPFLASLPLLALDPKLLPPLTKHHLRFFRADYHKLTATDKLKFVMRIPLDRVKQGITALAFPEAYSEDNSLYGSGARFISSNGDEFNNVLAKRPRDSAKRLIRCNELTNGLSANAERFHLLSEFLSWAKRHEIRVLATFPGIRFHAEYNGPAARMTEKTIRDFYKSRDVPILGTVNDAFLPDEDFLTRYIT